MEISTDFVGGNGRILSVEGDRVVFSPDMRDSEGTWFYWAFRVCGAQGKTLRFSVESGPWVGYYGPAVSRDLEAWQWGGNPDGDRRGFSYTFSEEENCVYFAHHMLYRPERFFRVVRRLGISCTFPRNDRKGTPIPVVTFGEGSRHILLTARHHCCESTGNYVMEGILEDLATHPLPDLRVTALPFVDADGVMQGDQGKNRLPHDHNRDYEEGLYPGVRLVRGLLARGDTVALFDLHSPWHLGGRNDRIFIVRKTPAENLTPIRFAKILEETSPSDGMHYRSEDDLLLGEDWNLSASPQTCAGYGYSVPGMKLSCTLETTYFGKADNVVSQGRLVAFGRSFGHAIRIFFGETEGESARPK